ncbi:FYVE and coiled-coil domain-containing protein 1-like isoform X2 [Pantherophis guttatus]|uniref:FYVE and coiled-coil domain-containing protein 1 n=1 Tax=Pantherophis guttatus TaxID=94885 RepID=A0A6P9ATQ4_PANGU|nr:FYVE and coiled-coil domain-containing protein 1 isoform X2 [Pantherophis guttatus]XP_060541902.1 FYVE and coiled-coil domain-containing protein 1-like isoform X2 [Pantherophis guttatus]
MARSSGETQLQRIIRDMQDAVTELNKEFLEAGEPITDDSLILHKFSYKLEYLLQFNQKEKSTLLGNPKDYWDYFCDCLGKVKGANDGIRFVKSISEFRTSLGKGRAFIRYSLVHQRLADTLQQCFMNTKVTSDWYYARSPFLNPKLSSDIIGHLYELTEIQFDLASRGYDLDAGWPTFARKMLCLLGSSAYLWKPPSRSSSMSSLAPDNLSSPNENSFLNTESLESLDDLHMDLDQAELQQKELQNRIQHLEKEKQEFQATIGLQKQQLQMEREKNSDMSEENDRLRKMLGELEKQISHYTQGTIQEFQKCLETLELNATEKQKECSAKLDDLESLKNAPDPKILLLNQELKTMEIWLARKDLLIDDLTAKLKSAEKKTEELATKANSLMDEKSHQAISQYESILKIEELLKKLCWAEEEKADAQKLHSELLSHFKIMEEELHVKEEKQKEFELKLKCLTISTKEESEKLLVNLEAMTTERAEFKNELAVKDKTIADFQIQLADILDYVKSLEQKLQEEKKEKAESERLLSHTKTTMGQEIKNLMEHLELLEVQLAKLSDMVKSLEEQKQEVAVERDQLKTKVLEMKHQITKQCSSLKNSSEENKNLKSQNTKQQQTYQKLEEKCRELDVSKSFLEGEVAQLRASEKQLQSQIDAMVSVDEKEKSLPKKNKLLDENLQNAIRHSQLFDEKLKALEADYQELKQNENRIAEFLSVVQAELQNAKEHNLQMEKYLSSSRQNEESLKLQLTEKMELLEGLESQCSQLQEQAEGYRIKIETLEKNCLHQAKIIESLTSEKISVEKAQLELVSYQKKEAKDLTLKLAVSEEQLNISWVEISRLQEEIIEFQAKLQQTAAEKQKLQGKLDVTESVLSEQKLLSQQLKEQNEILNRNHIQQLLQCKEEEEMQKNEWKKVAQQKAELEKNVMCLTNELSTVRNDLEVVNMENMEIKDLLQRTNMDMAELGIQICSLTSEKTEMEEKIAQVTVLRTTKEISIKEQEKVQLELTRFSKEKEKLEDSNVCAAIIPDLQTQLELTEKQTKSLQETSKEEVATIKFQLSTEILNYQTKFKALSEECEKLKEELAEQNLQANAAEEALKETQTLKRDLHAKLNLSMDQVTEYKATQQKKDEEIAELKEDLKRAQTEVSRTNEQIQDYCGKFNKMKSEQDNNEAKLLAELDDLTRTKQFLEEKLIELLRDKDALWQKSDALEFQQKLTAEQRWLGDAEVTSCLECQKEFGWMNRRHHCRMCGCIFCYYCCNSYAFSKQTGKKERCCRACFKKVTANPIDSELNLTSEESSSSSSLLTSPLSLVHKILVTNEASKSTDDAMFDIITEEEVGQIQEGDSVHSKNQTEEPLDHGVPDLNSTYSSSTVDESDDLEMTQDAEICLLKSGELMLKLPLTVEEILKFEEGTRELFIKSSTYSIIPITINETGLTINWVFSSDPKSVSFSVVYKQSEETSLDQCKVLIPMTRCNSHKETIRGNVKIRNAGIYTLIFDNTFSRFISKKVFFHLSVQRPVIYDGSDFP